MLSIRETAHPTIGEDVSETTGSNILSGFPICPSVTPFTIHETDPSGNLHATFASTDDHTSDTWLVIAAQNGDDRAFIQLVQQHTSMVSKVVGRITRNRADTDDCIQDTMLRAFLNIRSFHARSNFSSWLTRIGINSALMLLRKRRLMRESSIETPNGEDGTVSLHITDRSPNPEEAYLRGERQLQMEQALQLLSTRNRRMVEMQLRGYPIEEISACCGLSMQATKSRLSRGKKLLRQRLQWMPTTPLSRSTGLCDACIFVLVGLFCI
jgi:RNA polymerase sigma-70 factor, ECF subfamily